MFGHCLNLSYIFSKDFRNSSKTYVSDAYCSD